MSSSRANLVVLATGMKGSGKSKLLWERYVKHQPRVIHVDPNDEVTERLPGRAVRVLGIGATYDALEVAARKGARRFNIAVTGVTPGEVAQLLHALVPPEGPARSVAAAFGSLALECAEMGMLCRSSADVRQELERSLYNMRHHQLSLFMATQYPYALPPGARDNCDSVIFFQQRERQALQWARDVVGDQGAAIVRTLRDYSFLLYERGDGTLYLCDRHQHVVREFREDGAPLGAPARAPGAAPPGRKVAP